MRGNTVHGRPSRSGARNESAAARGPDT